MIVDVVQMRHRGVKLEKDELKVATPTRGRLEVFSRPAYSENKVVYCAALLDGTHCLLPGLDFMQLARLRGDSLVLQGIEQLGMRKQMKSYHQSWWCKIVREANPTVAEGAGLRRVAHVPTD